MATRQQSVIFTTLTDLSSMPAYYNEIDPYAAKWLRNLIATGQIAPGEVDERDIRKVSADDLRGFDQCHWFAGIGGWSLALRLAGWPDDKPVWTGSCPCQPFSAAGKRKAAADDRHLWPAWAHLIWQCRPAVIFGEQVAPAIKLGWLDTVFDDLETFGYSCAASVLPAAGVGAPHLRKRLWFVSERMDNTASARRERKVGWAEGEARHEARVRLSSPGSSDGRLDDAADERHEWNRSAWRGRNGSAHDGATSELGDAELVGSWRDTGTGAEAQGRPCLWPERDGARSSGAASGGLGDAAGAGREGIADRRRTLQSQLATTERADGDAASVWADLVWLPCSDGKSRPTQSGLFPLAHGLSTDMGSVCSGEDSPFRVVLDPKTGKSIGQAPWRGGMLRAYGNAIVPQLAAEFIQAYVETKETTP